MRPELAYAVSLWEPQSKKHIDKLERVIKSYCVIQDSESTHLDKENFFRSGLERTRERK